LLGVAAAPSTEPFERSDRDKGGATMKVRLDRTQILASDDLTLTLTVEGSAPVEVEAMGPLTPSRQWLVNASEPEVTVVEGTDRMRWRQQFRLSPLQAGAVPLPIAAMHYRTGSGGLQEYAWPTLTVQVRTDVLRPLLSEVRENTMPDLDVPPPPFNFWPPVIASLMCLVGGVALWRWHLRKPVVPALSAEEQAVRDLDRLAAEQLPARGEVDRFHTVLSAILRNYLQRQLGLVLASRATAELLTALQAMNRVPAERLEQIQAILGRCDLAKFARASYGAEDCQAILEQARDIVKRLPAELVPPPELAKAAR
jgi:hypothetical protein